MRRRAGRLCENRKVSENGEQDSRLAGYAKPDCLFCSTSPQFCSTLALGVFWILEVDDDIGR